VPGEYPDQELQGSADILFRATIKADELRFHAAPETRVEFSGDADARSTSGSVRTHLPDRVATKTSYRDITIDYAIAAKLS
jgi:hypothetical protein